MKVFFQRNAPAAQRGLHTCLNYLQYQGFPSECKYRVQKTLTLSATFACTKNTMNRCNTIFVLLRMLYGAYSCAKLD